MVLRDFCVGCRSRLWRLDKIFGSLVQCIHVLVPSFFHISATDAEPASQRRFQCQYCHVPLSARLLCLEALYIIAQSNSFVLRLSAMRPRSLLHLKLESLALLFFSPP